MSFFGTRSNGESSLATGGEQGSFFDNIVNPGGSESSHYSYDANLAVPTQHHHTPGVPPSAWSPTKPPAAWMQRPPPPMNTAASSYLSAPTSQPSGAQYGSIGSEFRVTNGGLVPPPPRRAASTNSSQDGSPSRSAPPLIRPPPRRITSHATLSPSGSVGSMTGMVGTGGVASRYVLPPTAAALEASSSRLGAPPPPPPPQSASTNGASNPNSLSSSPAPLGSRLSTLVNSERTKKSLQRFAPAASWLAAGASKIGSFVVGPDRGPSDDPGTNESGTSPDHSQAGIAPDSHGSTARSSAPPQLQPPSLDVAPAPQTSPQPPQWPQPSFATPTMYGGVLSTPSPVQSVPEATSTVPLNSSPFLAQGSNSNSTSGAALAMLADSAENHQPPGSIFHTDDAANGAHSSWLDPPANGYSEEPKASPQPLQRLAPAAKWLLAGAGKAAQFVTGVDRGPDQPDAGQDGSPSQQDADGAPAGAYSREPSTHSQSDPHLPAQEPASIPLTGEPQGSSLAADTAAQEEHYSGVAALIAASEAQGSSQPPQPPADNDANPSSRHRGREWGFGSFFMNRQGSRPNADSFSTNMDSSGEFSARISRAPPPPVYTRSSPTVAVGRDSPGTASTEQSSTIVHPSPHAGSPGKPPRRPSSTQGEASSGARRMSPSHHQIRESEGEGWAAQSSEQAWGHYDANQRLTSAERLVQDGVSAEHAPAWSAGDSGYGWHRDPDADHAYDGSAGAGAQSVWEGQGSYGGFGAPATGKPLTPVATHPSNDRAAVATPSGGGWLHGAPLEVAGAEDVAVDAHGEVQCANTPRAAESCTTPFKGGITDSFAGESFFKDPSMQLDAAAAEAEAPGSFFGVSSTPRAVDSTAHASASFFGEGMSQTPRAGGAAATAEPSFFGGPMHAGSGAAGTLQQGVEEAEDVTVDAYGEVQYASTPTPHATSGALFGDHRPVEDSSTAAWEPQPHEAAQLWGDGVSMWSAGAPTSAAAPDAPGAEVPGGLGGGAPWTTAEGGASSGDAGASDQQFSSILRSAGLHVRTDVDSRGPAASMVLSRTSGATTQGGDHAATGATDATDPQPHAIGSENIPILAEQHPELPASTSADDASMGINGAAAHHPGSAPSAPLTQLAEHEGHRGASAMCVPHEAEDVAQQREQLHSEGTDGVAPSMSNFAGLAGMIGWNGQKPQQGDDGQHARSPSQQSQQLPDATALPPPEPLTTPPKPADSLGGFPAAFAQFMRGSGTDADGTTPDLTSNRVHSSPDPERTIQNPLWSPQEQANLAKPPLPPSTLPRPPPPSVPTFSYGSSGSLGSALLPPPPTNFPTGSTSHHQPAHSTDSDAPADISSQEFPTAGHNTSLPDVQHAGSAPMHTAYPAPPLAQDATPAGLYQNAHQVSSMTELSALRYSTGPSEQLQPSSGLSHAMAAGDAAEAHMPAAPHSQANNPDSHAATSSTWSEVPGVADPEQRPQGITSTEAELAAAAEGHGGGRSAPDAMPPTLPVSAERPGIHPSGSYASLPPDSRYSSGTEYSMCKLPETTGLSALAPGPKPAIPTPARSTPASSPRARSVSASGANTQALQQYVVALESDKFELQRGLKRQMELVRKLADDHQEAETSLSACKEEVAELRGALDKANAALLEKERVAVVATQTAEAAQQAVQDVLDGRTLIVEENVALEEQLLALKNEAAAAQQQHSELESRLAAAAADVRAVQARADATAKRAEQDCKRLLDEIEELKEGRTTLLGRIRDMARQKGVDLNGSTAGVSPPGPAADAEVKPNLAASGGAAREVADAACQCSGAAGGAEAASLMVSRGLLLQNRLLEEEVEELQDPVSLRVAEQAAAAAQGSRTADHADQAQSAPASDDRGAAVGATGLGDAEQGGSLEGWRALLPPVGRGSGVVAAVADTQVGVLDSVHELLDRVAKDRVRSQQHIAAKAAEIQLLKAAVLASGGVVPQCGIWHDPTQPEEGSASPSRDAPLQGLGGAASERAGDSKPPVELEQAQQLHAADTGGSDPVSVSTGALAPDNVHQGHSRESPTVNGAAAAPGSAAVQADPSAAAQHHTPPKSVRQAAEMTGSGESPEVRPSPSRGWFGGMFGRSPSRQSPQRTLLNSA